MQDNCRQNEKAPAEQNVYRKLFDTDLKLQRSDIFTMYKFNMSPRWGFGKYEIMFL
ncbi:hypothetical protein D3C87_1448080 [compost metagenome]